MLSNKIMKAAIARRLIGKKLKQMFNRTPTGVILWEGASPQDGQPIAAIVTGLKRPSVNTKTGDMLQLWIIRTDIAPQEAVKNGQDISVCGHCIHRRSHGSKGDCYVIPHQAPLTVFKNYTAGKYPRIESVEEMAIFDGMTMRFGAYGDPAFIPVQILQDLSQRLAGHTGYTHQSFNKVIDERKRSILRGLLHASADSKAHARKLKKAGWRIFETRYDTKDTSGTLCAAERTGLSCLLCQECNGQGDDIYIIAHGNNSQKLLT